VGQTWPTVGWQVVIINNNTGLPLTPLPPAPPTLVTAVAIYPSLVPTTAAPMLPATALITMSAAVVTAPATDFAFVFDPGRANTALPFEYVEQRISDIVKVTEDYVVSVESFRLPTTLVPIFPAPPLGVYLGTVSLISFAAGTTFFAPVLVLPDNVNVVPTGVFFYQTVVNAVNLALATVWLNISGITPPPQILFDETAGLFSLYAIQGIFSPEIVPGRAIRFSPNLYYLFNSLPAIVTTGTNANRNDPTWYNLQVFNQGDNAYIAPGPLVTGGGLAVGNYWKMTQQTPSLAEWSQFESIVITSALPTQPENLPGSQQTQAGAELDPSRFSLPGQTNLRQTLFEWQAQSNPIPFSRNPAVFAAGSPNEGRRFVTLNSKGPLRDLNVYVWWQDRRLNLYPLLVPNDEYGNVKIQLRSKRSLGIYPPQQIPTEGLRRG
jgi:hypothetical protein